MHILLKKITIVTIAFTFITACANQQGQGPQVTKRDLGGLSGAIIGGILGSEVGGGSGQLWATGAGAIIGAVVGSEIGRSLDRADQMYAERALESAHEAPIGETISWSNPESGHSGTFTPLREGTKPSTRSVCREYETTIYIDGRAETGTGIACQQPDGTWAITD